MRDRVLVQAALEQVIRGAVAGLLAFDLDGRGVLFEDRGAGEAEQLGLREELLDGLVVLTELRAVALVKDEYHALLAQGLQLLLVCFLALLFLLLVALAVFVQRQAELLDGGDDDFVGVVVGQQAAHKCFGVGVLFDAAFLKAVEFFAGLAIQVFAIHHEQALVDVRVVLEQGGGLERGQRLARAGGVPDVAIAAVLVDALNDGFDGIDLVRPHHQQLLLAGHQHHVATDHLAQGALSQKLVGEAVELRDLLVVFAGELIDRQEALIRVEAEVPRVVVGEVPSISAIADDEELQEAQ